MMFKYMENTKYYIYCMKLQNVAFITRSCRMLQIWQKLQNFAFITFSRSTLNI